MVEIRENQELEVINVLSFRGKIKPNELDSIVRDMGLRIKEAGAKRIGNPITATFAMDKDGLELEVLLPINQEIADSEKYKFKSQIKIVNAVLASYKGNPAELQSACNELNQYVLEKQLQPITVGYNVTKCIDPVDVNNTEIDIYVGITPNIL